MSFSKTKTKKNLNTQSRKIDHHYFKLIAILGVVLLNLSIAVFVRYSGLFYQSNISPVGYAFGYYSSVVVLILTTYCIFRFELLSLSPISGILVLAGIYSNFVEKIIFNSSANYIFLNQTNLNIPTLEIYVGLTILNFQIWSNYPQKILNLKSI